MTRLTFIRGFNGGVVTNEVVCMSHNVVFLPIQFTSKCIFSNVHIPITHVFLVNKQKQLQGFHQLAIIGRYNHLMEQTLLLPQIVRTVVLLHFSLFKHANPIRVYHRVQPVRNC